jgi:hypothetical protein
MLSFNFALPEPEPGDGLSSPPLTRDETPSSAQVLVESSPYLVPLSTTPPHITTATANLAAQFIQLDAYKEMLQAPARNHVQGEDIRSKVESALSLLAYVDQQQPFGSSLFDADPM